jgi:ribosomal protein S7
MRVAKRSMAFNRLYTINYYINYTLIFISLFIKKGFKLFSYKVICNFFFLIKKKYKMAVEDLLVKVFEKYLPLVSLISKKIATIIYMLPWVINKIRARILLVRWFIKSSLERQQYLLHIRLFNEFNTLYFGYGKTIKILINYYYQVIKARPFTKFLRKRRKVFLIRLKKYGIR